MRRTVSILLVLMLVGGCSVQVREQPAPVRPVPTQTMPEQPTPGQVTPEQIDQLLTQLDDDDFEVREEATKKLTDLWDDDAAKNSVEGALDRAEEDGNTEVATRCVEILKKASLHRNLGLSKELVDQLGEENELILTRAIQEKKLLMTFEAWMNAPGEFGLKRMKHRAAFAEWVAGRLESRSDKITFLRYPNLHYRTTYQKAVSPFLSDADSGVRGWAACALAEMGAKRHIPDIAQLLKDENPWTRAFAAEALGRLDAKGHTKEIAELLRSDDDYDYLRESACRALGDLGAGEYAGDIAEFLKDGDDGLRSAAISALVDLRAKEFTGDLVRFLKAPTADSQCEAAWALGQLGAKECADEVAALMKHADANVRGEAAVALGRLGAKEQTRLVARLLKDGNANVRARAITALGQLEARDYCTDIAVLLGDADECCPMEPIDQFGTVTRVSAVAAQVLKSWGLDPERLKREREESEKR